MAAGPEAHGLDTCATQRRTARTSRVEAGVVHGVGGCEHAADASRWLDESPDLQ